MMSLKLKIQPRNNSFRQTIFRHLNSFIEVQAKPTLHSLRIGAAAIGARIFGTVTHANVPLLLLRFRSMSTCSANVLKVNSDCTLINQDLTVGIALGRTVRLEAGQGGSIAIDSQFRRFIRCRLTHAKQLAQMFPVDRPIHAAPADAVVQEIKKQILRSPFQTRVQTSHC